MLGGQYWKTSSELEDYDAEMEHTKIILNLQMS